MTRGRPRKIPRLASKERIADMDKVALDRYITGNWGEDSVPSEGVDKQEILEFLVNRRFITDDEAANLAELSIEEITAIYDGHAFGDPGVDSPLDLIDPRYFAGVKCGNCGGPVLADPSEHVVSAGKIYTCGECLSAMEDESADGVDDPRCAACGVYRSEHTLCGCSDGFVTAEGLRAEREQIELELRYEEGDYDFLDYEYPEGNYPEDDWDDDPELELKYEEEDYPEDEKGTINDLRI